MSILNGNIHYDVLRAEEMPFGAEFAQVGHIRTRCGNAADADVLGEGLLACAGKGALEIYRVEESGAHELLCRVEGLGDSRQLVCDHGYIYLSARADGLYILDARNPRNAKLAHHMDTLELATGVAAANGLLAVTNRHMGCELWDVRSPYAPRFLGSFPCGEAQSVWLYDRIAVISDWMSKEYGIFDISDPTDVKKLSTFAVDGFADGVCVIERDGRRIAMCGTGHHAARLKNRVKYKNYTFTTPEMLLEGWGCGHGVELYDITDPELPAYLSTLKTPPHFGGLDTWRVFSDGKHAYFTDSMGGIFEIDLSDLMQPRFAHHFRLPPKEEQKPLPSVQTQRGVIIGAAAVSGLLCACGEDGVRLLAPADGRKVGGFARCTPDVSVDVPTQVKPEPDGMTRFCAAEGQLHGFVSKDGVLYCAEGERGIGVVSAQGQRMGCIPTRGLCHDVAWCGDALLSCEGDQGLALYELRENAVVERSRLHFGTAMPVRTAVVNGGDVCVQLGSVFACLVRVENGRLAQVGAPIGSGMLYHRHLSRTNPAGHFLALSLARGPILYRATDEGLAYIAAPEQETCPFAEGACAVGEGVIAILRGRYYFLRNAADLARLPAPIPVEKARLSGIPCVVGDILLLHNRCDGTIELLDVRDPAAPRFIRRVKTGMNPEFADVFAGKLLLACGRQGLMQVDI